MYKKKNISENKFMAIIVDKTSEFRVRSPRKIVHCYEVI